MGESVGVLPVLTNLISDTIIIDERKLVIHQNTLVKI